MNSPIITVNPITPATIDRSKYSKNDIRWYIMTTEEAKATLYPFTQNGVLKGEVKLGGNSHEARMASCHSTKDMTAHQSAILYVDESPADVFVVNLTLSGTRGRAKVKVKDRMFAAFYPKAAIEEGVRKFGPAFTNHTNCVTFHSVTAMNMTATFGLPLCMVECPFTMTDLPRDDKRPQAPYAKAWETWISSTFHAHNVANLYHSKYDFRIVFVEHD